MTESHGFTLIELLIVIGLIAILSVVVIMTLNPAELLKQSRDANRLSDFGTLNNAMSIFAADQPSGSLGAASTTYVSIPDSSATCANLGLPALPAGWSYHCVPSSTLRNANGTGWLPVDFTLIAAGAPISQLPVDPVNTTSSLLYYTYTPGSGYETTAVMESQKYASNGVSDGGRDPLVYESGSTFSLSPFTRGLAGYWSFDEGTGSSAVDGSGFGNNGAWGGSGTHYAGGKRATAGSFNGSDDWVLTAYATPVGLSDITFLGWIKTSISQHAGIMGKRAGSSGGYAQLSFLIAGDIGGNTAGTRIATNDDGSVAKTAFSGASVGDGTWHLVAFVRQNQGRDAIYVDGVLDGQSASLTGTNLTRSDPFVIGNLGDAGGTLAGYFFSGLIDEVRIYKRAFSSQEIRNIYTLTQ